MNRIRPRAVLTATAVTSCLAAAALQGQQDANPRRLPSVAFDLGFVNTGGNSEVTTLNVGERLEYQAAPWVVTQRFSVVYGETDGVVSTALWKAGLRVGFHVSPRVGLFSLARFERNTFAGIARRFEESAGVTATLIEEGGNRLTAEAGASLNQQTSSTTDETQAFAAGRVAAEYQRALTEASNVTVGAEFLPNLGTTEDYRINGAVALVAPISKRIAVKLSYDVGFDNLPEPGFEKTDRAFTAGLQLVF